jgi:acyl-CoA oxidase
VKVSDGGQFEAVGGKHSTKLAFGSMLNTRIVLIHNMPYYLARMATIATRYSFLRRQFEGKDGNKAPETPIMLYQMQQVKIIPAISM